MARAADNYFPEPGYVPALAPRFLSAPDRGPSSVCNVLTAALAVGTMGRYTHSGRAVRLARQRGLRFLDLRVATHFFFDLQ